MNHKWKQVAESDFQTLSKYHNGEVRYYIDFNSTHRKTAGTPSKKTRGSRHPKVKGSGGINKMMALDTSGKEFTAGTKLEKMAAAVVKIFGGNPAFSYPRSTVVRCLMRDTGFGANQVQPGVTDLLKYGHLKYVDDSQKQLPLGQSKSQQKRVSAQKGNSGHSGLIKPHNVPLSLTTKEREVHLQGTVADVVQRAVYRVFDNDPTNVIPRTTVIKRAVEITPDAYGKLQVAPHLSKMVKTGQVRRHV